MKLTFKQVVEKIGANSSTLAFQRNKFSEFIDCTGDGRFRRYGQGAIDVLSITSKMYAEGKTYDEIKEVLEGRYGIRTDIIPMDNNTSTTQQEDLVQSLRSMLQQELNRRDELILELQEELESIKQTLLKQDERNEDRARSAESRDNEVLQAIRALQAESQQRNKKWWRFWR